MTRKRLIPTLLILWALLWLGSTVIPIFQAPTGDSFTRGLNRVGTFFGLQIAAGLVGLAILALRPKDGAYRRLAIMPSVMTMLLVLALATIILWARLPKPDPVTPGPTTQPAANAMPLPKPNN